MRADIVCRRSHRLVLLAALGLLAAGCMGNKKMDVCPRVAVVGDASSLTRFRPGPGRDILDIDFQANMTDVRAACEYPDKKAERREVVVQVAPVLVFSRGAANGDRKAQATYFVSVVRNAEVLTKQEFVAAVDFVGNRSRVLFNDTEPPITIDIPLSYKAAEYEYEVLLGLQLTPEELEETRKWRGLGR